MTSEMNLFGEEAAGEAELVATAMKQPLLFKIQVAVNLLKHFEPPEGYYLAYSGGKDSDCIMELAVMAGVKFTAWYNCTTLDPPELVNFIKKMHPEVQWNRQPRAMLTHMVEKCKGLPTRHGRWCCQVYKEQGGNGQVKVIGVRAAESPRRAKMWKSVVPNRKTGKPIICPIIYWTDEDVWEFHRLREIPYCRLYDEGHKRLGCIGCPMGNPRRDFERWPKYRQLYERATKKFWDRWHNVPNTKTGKPRFFVKHGSWEAYFEWWLTGKKADIGPVCQMEFLFSDHNRMISEEGTDDDFNEKPG